MNELPTFVTSDDLVKFVVVNGLLFILIPIGLFLLLYRFSVIRRIKDEIKKRKDLTNLEHRSNGHHKKEKINL